MYRILLLFLNTVFIRFYTEHIVSTITFRSARGTMHAVRRESGISDLWAIAHTRTHFQLQASSNKTHKKQYWNHHHRHHFYC